MHILLTRPLEDSTEMILKFKSLSIEDKITEAFSTQKIIPSAGQGVISLQCRNDDR